jgi:hypothetical protein
MGHRHTLLNALNADVDRSEALHTIKHKLVHIYLFHTFHCDTHPLGVCSEFSNYYKLYTKCE